MIKFLVLFLLVLAGVEAGKYNGYKAFEITPKTPEHFSVLQRLSLEENNYEFLELSHISGRKAKVLVSPKAEKSFRSILQDLDISFKILSDNIEAIFRSEINQNKLLKNLKPSIEGRLSTERYYSHDEINTYLEDLAKRYPTRDFLKTFGHSFEGRLLKILTITNGDGRTNKNVILMDGGFHAREWISPAAVIYAIDQLVEYSKENADLLLDYDWVILPVVNPDGYEFTQTSAENRTWRKTRKPNNGSSCIGTDPNRNFDFHWNEAGASSDPCSSSFAGPTAFSEPETIVMRDIIETYKERGMFYLTVHSQGMMILHPWGWTEELPDTWRDLDEVAKAGADAIKEYNDADWEYGSSTLVLYIAAGASDDYAFNAGYPISFTMELRGGIYGHDPPTYEIDPFVKEAWVGIRAMAKRVTEKYPLNKETYFSQGNP